MRKLLHDFVCMHFSKSGTRRFTLLAEEELLWLEVHIIYTYILCNSDFRYSGVEFEDCCDFVFLCAAGLMMILWSTRYFVVLRDDDDCTNNKCVQSISVSRAPLKISQESTSALNLVGKKRWKVYKGDICGGICSTVVAWIENLCFI